MDKFPPTARRNCLSYLGGFLGALFGAECDEAVAPVELSQWVHHQTQIPDLSTLLKQRNQLIFKHILGDFPAENLQYGFLKSSLKSKTNWVW